MARTLRRLVLPVGAALAVAIIVYAFYGSGGQPYNPANPLTLPGYRPGEENRPARYLPPVESLPGGYRRLPASRGAGDLVLDASIELFGARPSWAEDHFYLTENRTRYVHVEIVEFADEATASRALRGLRATLDNQSGPYTNPPCLPRSGEDSEAFLCGDPERPTDTGYVLAFTAGRWIVQGLSHDATTPFRDVRAFARQTGEFLASSTPPRYLAPPPARPPGYPFANGSVFDPRLLAPYLGVAPARFESIYYLTENRSRFVHTDVAEFPSPETAEAAYRNRSALIGEGLCARPALLGLDATHVFCDNRALGFGSILVAQKNRLLVRGLTHENVTPVEDLLAFTRSALEQSFEVTRSPAPDASQTREGTPG